MVISRYTKTRAGTLLMWLRDEHYPLVQYDSDGSFHGALENIERAMDVNISLQPGDAVMTKEEAILYVLERRASRALTP